VGTEVIIDGNGVLDVTSVTFGGVPAQFRALKGWESFWPFGGVLAIVPDGAPSGPIILVTLAGSAATSFDFMVGSPKPVITSITPDRGAEGSFVTIRGVSLPFQDYPGDGAVVRFSGTAGSLAGDLAGGLTAQVPVGAASGRITLETPYGLATSPEVFIVTNRLAPPPVVNGFAPESGIVGDRVALSGADIGMDVISVTFNGIAASFAANLASDTLSAVVPAGATSGPITVTTRGGAWTTTNLFTVLATPTPQIVSFAPTNGPPETVIQISGLNLDPVTEVWIGSDQVKFGGSVIVDSGLFAIAPAGRGGRITVRGPGGTATSQHVFVVVPRDGPAITGFDPLEAEPGQRVRIRGVRLEGATEVRMGGVKAEFDAAALTAVVPSGAVTGPIEVETPAGTATSLEPLTVLPGAELAVLGDTQLVIRRMLSGHFEVWWSARDTNLVLQVCNGVASAHLWTTVESEPQTAGDKRVVRGLCGLSNRFYRLGSR
jgi:hypothetical protein